MVDDAFFILHVGFAGANIFSPARSAKFDSISLLTDTLKSPAMIIGCLTTSWIIATPARSSKLYLFRPTPSAK